MEGHTMRAKSSPDSTDCKLQRWVPGQAQNCKCPETSWNPAGGGEFLSLLVCATK